jgi:hypothetical protein
MMRFVWLLFVVSLIFPAACKKSGGSNTISKMAEFRDKMCGCTDAACVKQVKGEMSHFFGAASVANSSAEDKPKLKEIAGQLSDCVSRVMNAPGADTAATGSDSAGSGSDSAGSGAGSADGAATGSGAADGSRAHRMGMCPSTVYSATTTSAVKGKSVVLTIQSTDKDAIGGIQRRTDELLAEKQHPPTGGAHDMRGSHGGGRGICPVFLPEGARAVAKHEPGGVVITITPKDNVDELAKDIHVRIAKSSAWVMVNVKPGEQGNQGAVGGGKGEDGSNHSGRGDGKGRERQGAGSGGGGGKGTGGGGGKGSGGGGGSNKPG